MSLQKVTDLWCEGVNDLGRKWFCELENKQDPDLSPRDGGGLLKRRFRREEGSVLIRTRRNLLITSCCGHNKEGRQQQWGEIFKSGWTPVPYNDKQPARKWVRGSILRAPSAFKRKLAATVTTPTIWPETQFDNWQSGLSTIIPLKL
jgi:hypothetical protein